VTETNTETETEPDRQATIMGLFKKKPTVDPVDFLALRAELQDVKARLDASEQAKAYLEARLGSLDATTSALSTHASSSTQEVGVQISALLERVHAAETEASRVSSLQRRVDDVELRQSAGASDLRADELAPKLAELASRLEEVAELVSTTPPAGNGSKLSGPVGHATTAENDEALRARVDELAATAITVERLADQLTELQQRVGEHAAVASELDGLNERIGQLQAQAGNSDEVRAQLTQLAERTEQIAQVAEHTSSTDALAEQIAQLAERTEQVAHVAERATSIDALADQIAQLTERSASTDGLAQQLAQLAERVALSANDAREAREQSTALEARVSSVGTELANQLSELGKEIDALAAQREAEAATPAVAPMQAQVSDEVLATIRAGQARLANEQARYEIAFREDLATLAEQVRLLRGR